MNDSEIMLEIIRSNQRACNFVYTKINREPTEQVCEVNYELVKAFNALVDINQRLIDVLHPNRKKVSPTYLKYRNVNHLEKKVDIN